MADPCKEYWTHPPFVYVASQYDNLSTRFLISNFNKNSSLHFVLLKTHKSKSYSSSVVVSAMKN